MRKFYSLVLLIIAVASSLTVSAQGLKGFKLKNGLSVYIWEDSTKNDVFGLVGVKVGAVNDPEDLTGLAHYLEHMMFKGTQSISSLNWEKEKPLYEQIITKYDEMANEPDPVKKEAISLEINKLTVEAAQYTAPNEFAGLTENMGGKMLNAMTGYDETMYFSSFPPSQLYKWLDLNSERFINPVFRAFQPELETVYEEFNRSQDMQGSLQQDFMLKHIFPGHPYSRSVLGLQEHLKNPRLGGLVDFYNNWYVPENMVLILVGNVKLKEAMGLINDRFGRLEAQKSPERKSYPEMEIKGRTEYSAKMGDFPTLRLAFKGVPTGHTDELALIICVNMLGEGFDFPRLKIAAIHDPHKSIATTIQFVGRFTRTSNNKIGDATIIANISNEMTNKAMEELYSQDSDWNKIIRQTADVLVDKEDRKIKFLQNFEGEIPEIVPLQNIYPALSMYTFKTKYQNFLNPV